MDAQRKLATLALAAGISLLGACSEGDGAPTPQGPAPGAGSPGRTAVRVEAVPVSRQPLARELVAVGSLRADESVTLASEVAGRITRIAFQEGQPVKAGALLFELDDAIVAAEREQARASVDLARRNDQRAADLFERKLLAAQERDEVAAELRLQEASLLLAQARFEKTRILAPFGGVVGLRLVSPGDYVDAGQALVDLQAIDPLKVDFRLPEQALSAVATGQTLRVEVESAPGQVFEGQVYAIDPLVADDTRSIAVRARLANPGLALRPGQFASVRLEVERKEDALVIDEQAIFPSGDKQFVYIVSEGKAELREVSIGQRQPGQVEVLAGLEEGELLVLTGIQRLSEGIPVTVQTAAAGG